MYITDILNSKLLKGLVSVPSVQVLYTPGPSPGHQVANSLRRSQSGSVLLTIDACVHEENFEDECRRQINQN